MTNDGIRRAVDELRNGGVVAFPTDTVYGLGANGLDPQAVRRIFLAKRRPMDTPVPLLVADMAMLESTVTAVSPLARALIRRFMPGPLTLVLPRAKHIPDEVTAGGETVGVRIPDHPVPIALARGLGAPIVGTSANRSGFPSAVTGDEVRVQLGADVDCVLDGECWGKLESTVIDLSGKEPRVLRKGALTEQEVAEFLAGIAGTGQSI